MVWVNEKAVWVPSDLVTPDQAEVEGGKAKLLQHPSRMAMEVCQEQTECRGALLEAVSADTQDGNVGEALGAVEQAGVSACSDRRTSGQAGDTDDCMSGTRGRNGVVVRQIPQLTRSLVSRPAPRHISWNTMPLVTPDVILR